MKRIAWMIGLVLPLALLQRFYLDVEAVARSRGVNPDAPPGLNKVTKTV